ncbi:PREDICTED: coiled-coil-helix-coiled-coil-helix domain-containing protein 1-like [Branchiostoma belcheri]|uniref:Coiled-coil-helix-coiled-coil-helix domain-containing protein 1-like n=1 Tax=Branchiostoma belcheri TaxID=7741 RepID=A0A6P4ZMP8_BRABE|nr:PREDICTED: coiled-coil-helix-coiled-coil-helix domain-containing protein 1-like [Branchiostoma belcheri]KAI8521657.1 mitochondrial translation [Branchiostoma belcheri]
MARIPPGLIINPAPGVRYKVPAVKKLTKELILKDKVKFQKNRLGAATCLTEMSLMMACWKENDFKDSACAKEIAAFHKCTQEATKERRRVKEADLKGVVQEGRLSSRNTNKLLQRFPHPVKPH